MAQARSGRPAISEQGCVTRQAAQKAPTYYEPCQHPGPGVPSYNCTHLSAPSELISAAGFPTEGRCVYMNGTCSSLTHMGSFVCGSPISGPGYSLFF